MCPQLSGRGLSALSPTRRPCKAAPHSAFPGPSPLSSSPSPWVCPDLVSRPEGKTETLPSGQARTSSVPSDSSPGATPGLLTGPHCVGGMGRADCQFRKGGAALGRPKSLSAAPQNCKCHHIPAQEERASKKGKRASNNGGSPTQCLSPSWSHRAAQQEATARSPRQLQPIPKMSLKQSCCPRCLLWSIMTDSSRKCPASSPTPLPLRSKHTPSPVFSDDRGLVIGLLARCPCGCLLIWLPLCEDKVLHLVPGWSVSFAWIHT